MDALAISSIVGILVAIFVVYSILFIPSISKNIEKQNGLLEQQNNLLEQLLKKENKS